MHFEGTTLHHQQHSLSLNFELHGRVRTRIKKFKSNEQKNKCVYHSIYSRVKYNKPYCADKTLLYISTRLASAYMLTKSLIKI